MQTSFFQRGPAGNGLRLAAANENDFFGKRVQMQRRLILDCFPLCVQAFPKAHRALCELPWIAWWEFSVEEYSCRMREDLCKGESKLCLENVSAFGAHAKHEPFSGKQDFFAVE